MAKEEVAFPCSKPLQLVSRNEGASVADGCRAARVLGIFIRALRIPFRALLDCPRADAAREYTVFLSAIIRWIRRRNDFFRCQSRTGEKGSPLPYSRFWSKMLWKNRKSVESTVFSHSINTVYWGKTSQLEDWSQRLHQAIAAFKVLPTDKRQRREEHLYTPGEDGERPIGGQRRLS